MNRVSYFVGVMVLSLALTLLSPTLITRDSYLLVCFLDVGQGDAAYVADDRSGVRVLIDGGPYSSVVHALDDLIPFWDRRIDLVIATHPDDDHISGLVGVLKRFEVRLLLGNEDDKETATTKALDAYSQKYAIPQEVGLVGRTMVYPSGLRLEWLWPKQMMDGWRLSSNDQSQVVLLERHDLRVLLTGDLSANRLVDLLSERGIDRVDVLKVSHHGARDGMSQELLDYLEVEHAILSVGIDNRYGHPHREVLEMLEVGHAQVHRTDLDGNICFKDRESGLSVYP